MDRRHANIDIVFRNGLKDFEVIPPADIWEDINPNIKRKRKPVVLISIAASAAILFTIGFLTYQLNRQVTSTPYKLGLALNNLPAIASKTPNAVITIKASKENLTTSISTDSSLPVTPDNLIDDKIIAVSSPEPVFLQEANSLPVNFTRPGNRIVTSSLNKSQKNIYTLNVSDLQYTLLSAPQKVPERWSVTAMASPTYYSHFNSGGNEITKQLMSSEQTLISYSGGLSFSYKISKRVSVQSGLYYASMGQVVDGINSFAGFQKYSYSKGDHNFEVLTSNGTIYTRNADVFLSATGSAERISTNYTSDVFDPNKVNLQYINSTISQNFSYLELPVLLRYKIIDKTIDVNLIGGVSYNLLVNNSVYTMVNGSKYSIGETEKLNPLSISSTVGMGMEYNFSEKLSLNLEPTLRYYLNPINGSIGSNVHPYSFGIFSGFSYKF